LTSIDRRSQRESHTSFCDTTRYLAFQITENAYKGKHTTTDCKCDYVSLQGELNFIKERIDEGFIPVVSLKSGDQTEGLQVGLTAWGGEPWSKDFSFVAIPHIWADGIGNTVENAIPSCQLRRLQEADNELYPAETRISPCRALLDRRVDGTHRSRGKSQSYCRNEPVYCSADKVLVFNASLERIESDRDP
jgi:hypothetical protein